MTATWTPTSTATRTPTRTATPGPGSISGSLVYGLSGIAGIPVGLYLCGATDLWDCTPTVTTRIQQTTTTAGGVYSFANPPALSAGQSYYVAFLNPGSSLYLEYWKTALISPFNAGQQVVVPQFNIATINLQSPSVRASVRLPVQFSWLGRGIDSNERYAWALADSGTEVCYEDPPQPLPPTFILDSAGFSTCELSYNNLYSWYVYAVQGSDWNNGYGAAYEKRSVTFIP